MTPVLLCLHGWGGSKESFSELREALKNTDIEILTPDLPGFGSEPEPDRPWTVDDYAEWVAKWFEQRTHDKTFYLLGHSHGGRIALKLATHQSALHSSLCILHLFLCAPAGIRHERMFRRAAGRALAGAGKTVLSLPGLGRLAPVGKRLLYKLLRAHDYERASPRMRETMERVTREDLRPILKNVAVPTDLFWGTADTMTQYTDALLMRKEIPDATLHTFRGARHGIHRTHAAKIAAVIRERLAPQ